MEDRGAGALVAATATATATATAAAAAAAAAAGSRPSLLSLPTTPQSQLPASLSTPPRPAGSQRIPRRPRMSWQVSEALRPPRHSTGGSSSSSGTSASSRLRSSSRGSEWRSSGGAGGGPRRLASGGSSTGDDSYESDRINVLAVLGHWLESVYCPDAKYKLITSVLGNRPRRRTRSSSFGLDDEVGDAMVLPVEAAGSGIVLIPALSVRPDDTVAQVKRQIAKTLLLANTGSSDGAAHKMRLFHGHEGRELTPAAATLGSLDVCNGKYRNTGGGRLRRWRSSSASSCSSSGTAVAQVDSLPIVVILLEKLRLSCRAATTAVRTLCVTADGQFVITGANDNTACVWSLVENCKLVWKLRGHEKAVCTLCTCVCAETGQQFAITGSCDCTARVWNLADGAVTTELRGHSRGITKVDATADGQ